MQAVAAVALGLEEQKFTVGEQIALRDLGIRERFAATMLRLFAVTNIFVSIALGLVFWMDHAQLAAGLIEPADRIIDTRVVITLLGATTVQLGAVIYTMAHAIFPTTTTRNSS